ncbi:hypothetical protein TKK_0015999 [Trichogramma kaykai]|uniref:Peptidase S1 domain-containing protein n=1 Tax=Trichogramma kaykai TaxID=54128 RepID=A0ABD2W9Y8_9HYME
MKNLFIEFFVSLALVSSLHVVGHPVDNGEEARPEDFKYHVVIRRKGQYICSGALIADSHVLTAAHCVKKDKKHLSVLAGTTNLWRYEDDDESQARLVAKVLKVHIPSKTHIQTLTNIAFNTKYYLGDIAVLKLDRPLGKSSRVSKLKLASSLAEAETSGTVAGYAHLGSKDGRLIFGPKLLYTRVNVMKNNDCQELHRSAYRVNFCANSPRDSRQIVPVGVCQGDSGSPLVQGDRVVGVLSSGPKKCGYNALPGIYVSVSTYKDFIDCVVQEDS